MTQHELVNIKDIKNNPDNPRTLKDDKFHKLVKSIQDFPEMLNLRPIVVNDAMIVLGGNMRLKACTEAGLKEVPIIKASNLTEDQQREFIIKDNSSFWEWDYETLKSEWDVDELIEWWLDIELPEIIDEEKEAIEDDVPDVVEFPIVEKGDIFQLWEHRLMCGSSTDVNDLEALLWKGNKSDMVFTDPPYLMDFTGWLTGNDKEWYKKWFNAKHWAIKNDKMSKEDWEQFLDDINTNIRMYNKWAFYITFYRFWIAWYLNSMERVWLENRAIIIWAKGNHTLSNSDYMSKYEPMFYGWCDEHNFYWGNNGMDIWEIARTKKNDLHPTMKPVELVDKAIKDGSKKWDIVLDLFWGSWTTLISAEKNNRISRVMELDEKYIQVILKRYNTYTDWQKEIKCLNRELDISSII